MIRPIVQNIEAPSVRRNFHLASLFAVKLGKGALVATSFDLRDTRPEFRQLKQSLVNYLARGAFAEASQITRSDLLQVMDHPRFKVVPEPVGKKVLEVNPAAKAQEEGFKPWKPGVDGVVTKAPGFDYRFENVERRWGVKAPADMVLRKGDKVRAWSLNRSMLCLTCPKGFAGTIYLRFQDPEKSGKRKGYVYGLGGAVMADKLDGDGVWAALKVRPDDSATGEIQLFFRKFAYGDGWSTTPLVTGLVVAE